MHSTIVEVGENSETKPSVSRREFLAALSKAAIVVCSGSLATIAGATRVLRPFDIDHPMIEPTFNINANLGEHYAIWPFRPTVLINNMILASRLNGKGLVGGTTYSFNEITGITNMMPIVTDFDVNNPKYVVDHGIKKTPPFLTVIPAGGVCFSATMLARSLVSSPVLLNEWHSHTTTSGFYMEQYFMSDSMKCPHGYAQVFSRLGTDAAVYAFDEDPWDLVFTPLTDMHIDYTFHEITEGILGPPLELEVAEDLDDLSDWILNNATRFSARNIVARLCLSHEGYPYSVKCVSETERVQCPEVGLTVVPVFERFIETPDGVFYSKNTVHYDLNGNAVNLEKYS